MKSLTTKQRDVLQRIWAIRDLQVKQIQQVIDQNSHMAGSKPSQWVYVMTLTSTHHIPRNVIKALVKKGYLEERPTDGFGPEVKISQDVKWIPTW